MTSYTKMVNSAWKVLKPLGYKKENNNFIIDKGKYRKQISFVRSQYHYKDEVLFSVEIRIGLCKSIKGNEGLDQKRYSLVCDYSSDNFGYPQWFTLNDYNYAEVEEKIMKLMSEHIIPIMNEYDSFEYTLQKWHSTILKRRKQLSEWDIYNLLYYGYYEDVISIVESKISSLKEGNGRYFFDGHRNNASYYIWNDYIYEKILYEIFLKIINENWQIDKLETYSYFNDYISFKPTYKSFKLLKQLCEKGFTDIVIRNLQEAVEILKEPHYDRIVKNNKEDRYELIDGSKIISKYNRFIKSYK